MTIGTFVLDIIFIPLRLIELEPVLGNFVLKILSLIIFKILLIANTILSITQNIESLTNEELIIKCTQKSQIWEKNWQEFENRFGRLILLFILKEFYKSGGDKYVKQVNETVKDLRQDVYIKLLRDDASALRNFKGNYEQSFFAYLNIISINVVKNFVKHQKREKRSSELTSHQTSIDGSQFEITASTNDTREELNVQFCKHSIIQTLIKYYHSRNIERDIQIFKLFYFEDISAEDIYNLHNLKLSISGIETLLSRMKSSLKKHYVN